MQLNLEDETIRLNAPKGSLTPALQAELKANKPGLLELLRAAQKNVGTRAAAPIPRVARQERMPLSFAQQRLWFLQQMDPESTAYNLLSAILMEGSIDAGLLEQSIHRITLRHENLRTSFGQYDGSPYTQIADGCDWRMDILPLDRSRDESLASAVTRFTQQTTNKPFNLEQGPLLRAYLLHWDEHQSVLLLSMHHIVSDGWSMGVMIRELTENYRALRVGESPRLPDLAIQYVDWSVWQPEWLASGVWNARCLTGENLCTALRLSFNFRRIERDLQERARAAGAPNSCFLRIWWSGCKRSDALTTRPCS